jgi:GNAT superfamily N-acetyltransferase
VTGACVATVASGAENERAMLAEGFAVVRRWDEYEIPVGPAGPVTPVEIRTADEVEQDRLAALDAELRGAEPDLAWFRRETYESPYFDPLTYRVAADGDRYVGLARIWLGPRPRPHLGTVGVLAAYRRRGIGRALLAAALRPLAGRGVPVVTAAAVSADAVSAAFLRAFHAGARGGWTELARRTGTASPP